MIVTVTLNASIDKRYLVEKLNIGQVNRVAKCTYSSGGKGLNVSRVAVLAGERVTATGFVGGYNGQLLEELAEKDGINTAFIHTQGETRSCVNIKDAETQIQTELLEGGEAVTSEDVDEMKKQFGYLLEQAEAVTISGSVPKGVTPELYKQMIQNARASNIPVLLDTSGNLLNACVHAQIKPTLIKPNQDEIGQLTGKTDLSETELTEAVLDIRSKGIPYIVVSLGKEGSLMASPTGVYKARVPEIEAVNTVGCGDSMLAGLAIGLKNRWQDEKTLRFASAVSAANALQEATGFFEREDMEALYEKVQIEKV